jgi:hypothetical protein
MKLSTRVSTKVPERFYQLTSSSAQPSLSAKVAFGEPTNGEDPLGESMICAAGYFEPPFLNDDLRFIGIKLEFAYDF